MASPVNPMCVSASEAVSIAWLMLIGLSNHCLRHISGQEGPRRPRFVHSARMAKTKVLGEFGRVKILPPRLVIERVFGVFCP